MYVFALFYDNISHIFNMTDISLHVKLIMRISLPYFCVRYILLLNLTAYSQYMQSHSFQNYHQVSRVITGSRLNRLRINLCINITIAAITGVITSIQKPRSFASASHIDQHAYCSRHDKLPMDVLRAVPGENTIHPRLPDHQNQSRGLHSVHVPVRSDLHPCRHHEKNTDRQAAAPNRCTRTLYNQSHRHGRNLSPSCFSVFRYDHSGSRSQRIARGIMPVLNE